MNSQIKILAVKYISGQTSEEEAEWFKAWIKESPQNEKYYIDLYETWHNSLIAKPEINIDKAYADFLARTSRTSMTGVFDEPERDIRIRHIWRGIAAAAAIVLCFSIGFYYFSKPVGKESEFIVFNVLKGARKHLILPDGSNVWVNAGSTLKYQKDFGRTSRTVYLSGEAYFNIAPSAKTAPFLVKTKDFVIRDIGTVFNIKAYSEMPVFEAAVLEGEVSVEGTFTRDTKTTAKVFLKRRQVLKIDTRRVSEKVAAGSSLKRQEKARMPVQIQQINPEEEDQYIGWKDGLLVFYESSFGQIAKDIERRYNVKINFVDEDLKEFKYSGSFRSVKDVTTVFEIIRKTTPINYSVRGNEIFIRKE